MHELSLAQGLVEQVQQAAAAEGALRVVSISLELGQYSGVEREAFEFAFPLAAEGTCLAGAELVIREIPVSVLCNTCHRESNPVIPLLICTHCESTDVKLIGGREFLVKSVELEIEEE
ncbi:MAG: hydrogenase maturation nickel metallochaperone HypA [Kiritimatiellales bacterium]|nr:hydrogenase maturation nickel metallochaperone HypA [Kiritimatiellales bacterium]